MKLLFQTRGLPTTLMLGMILLSCRKADREAADPSPAPEDTDETRADTDTDGDTGAPTLAGWDDARPIIEAHCSRCHSADRISTYRRLETHRDVTALRAAIVEKIGTAPAHGLRMPLVSNHTDTDSCTPDHVQLNDRRLSDEEAATLLEFLGRTDHLDYTDTYPPLVPPEVPALADAVTYTSTQFEVLNDGFLEPPEGASDDYMEEYGYDAREYDQMEDDWLCIRFDPARTDPGYLTGVQVLTDSGQIYLNAQLVIDTTGGSAAAQASAAERGPDWYRCDAGLGFSDALPLWRTVPGGAPITLPEATGLRFAPGWTFVLRADFHTHYDADEFNRLGQDGFIDTEAGTMTWLNRATLQARWAAPEAITRELSWLTVGPESQADRDAFAVVPGQSSLRYTASLPADAEARYAVFSAEVGMGKLGHVASLIESTSGTCVASNANFSPKWIEQALYAEEDAPTLSRDSTLTLQCDYLNDTSDSVSWDSEGEATVWGRKERCSALIFYYPLP